MSPTQYFALRDNMGVPDRWNLRSPVDEQGQPAAPWPYTSGEWIHGPPAIRFPVDPEGSSFDFTLASFLIPVVTSRVVSLFDRLGISREVQFIPTTVGNHPEPYFILNAVQTIRCIDDGRCAEARYWLPADNRPDKTGQYRSVIGLKIAAEKAGSSNIFRPWGWTVALIVSERVKSAMEHEGITGPEFTEV